MILTPLRFALLSLCLPLLCACGPEDGAQRPEVSYWEKGQPPILQYEGQQVYYKGEWLKDGEATYYDQLGQVTGKGTFSLGLEDGPWSLIEDGFRGEGSFSKGKRSGEWVYHYPSGKIQEKGSYLDGKRVGEWRSYYSNGLRKTLSTYVDGILEGSTQTWDQDGDRL